MGQGFSFRTIGALDLDLAARFHHEAFAPRGEHAWTRQDLAEVLATPGVTGCFVQDEGQDVGFALLRVVADEAELLTIAVAVDHRRRGAGRALLEMLIGRARGGGAKNLFLEVEVANQPALDLYAQFGFQAVGRRAAYYERRDGPPAEALVMRLVLTSGG
jgi:ribosomal-protein-alanine N-acetyltransferase